MNTIKLFSLFFLIAINIISSQSEKELMKSDSLWNSLRLSGDYKNLSSLLSDDWILIHSDGRIQQKEDYLSDLSSRSRQNGEIFNKDVQIRTYGNTAVINGMSIQSGISNGVPWSGKFRFTRVWIFQNSKWVMISSHSSRLRE